MSFNKDKLTIGTEYDYITRTSQNQGILQKIGFVNESNINPKGVWSLGLLQMDFFYREREWYAGQFVRKIIPKIEISQNSVLFFTSILNGLKKELLSVLVRDVDEKFRNLKIYLPIKSGNIDFNIIEKILTEFEIQNIKNLDIFLTKQGLKNYNLSSVEEKVLENFEKDNIDWEDYEIDELFDVSPSKAYKFNDSKIITPNGTTPYVSNQSQDNGYIGFSDLEPLNSANVITLSDTWQSERTIFYQPKEFIGKSHLQVLKPYNAAFKKFELFFIVSSFRKAILLMNYDYGTKFNRERIKTTKIQIPSINKKPNYELMETFMTAIQKLVIKDVVQYADKKMLQ